MLRVGYDPTISRSLRQNAIAFESRFKTYESGALTS